MTYLIGGIIAWLSFSVGFAAGAMWCAYRRRQRTVEEHPVLHLYHKPGNPDELEVLAERMARDMGGER